MHGRSMQAELLTKSPSHVSHACIQTHKRQTQTDRHLSRERQMSRSNHQSRPRIFTFFGPLWWFCVFVFVCEEGKGRRGEGGGGFSHICCVFLFTHVSCLCQCCLLVFFLCLGLDRSIFSSFQEMMTDANHVSFPFTMRDSETKGRGKRIQVVFLSHFHFSVKLSQDLLRPYDRSTHVDPPFLIRLGLFCTQQIPRGALIHQAPCLIFPRQSYEDHARHTVLEHYLYNCKNGDRLLALGYGSIFNHHRQPNVDYRIDKDKLEIKYYAARDVIIGEELW